MKTTYTATIVLALAALSAGHAMADEVAQGKAREQAAVAAQTSTVEAPGKTREQVKAELFAYRAAHKNYEFSLIPNL